MSCNASELKENLNRVPITDEFLVNWPFISDHLPHTSCITIDGVDVNIATWNILNMRAFGAYISTQWKPVYGKATPGQMLDYAAMVDKEKQDIRKKRIINYVTHLIDYGYIVCLQEVDDEWLREDNVFTKAIPELKVIYQYRGFNNCNAVCFLESTYSCEYANPVNEFTQILNVTTHGIKFTLINAHIQFGKFDRFHEKLEKQLDNLGRVVLVGDLNLPVYKQRNQEIKTVDQYPKWLYSIVKFGFTHRCYETGPVNPEHRLDCYDHIMTYPAYDVKMEQGFFNLDTLKMES